MNNEALWTKPYTLTLLASFLIFIPYSLYLPVLPVYVLDELHGSLAAAGMVNAVFLLASVLFRAQTSRFESMFGVRTVLLASGFLFMFSNCLFLLTDATALVLLIRFFSGACFAIVNTCINAIGSRLAPLKRKGEGLGYLTMVVTAGNAIGPYIGLNLAKSFGFSRVFIFSAAISLAGFLIALMIDVQEEPSTKQSAVRGFALRDLFEAQAMPASGMVLLLSVANAAVITFVTVYANSLRLDAAAAYFFVVMATCSVGSRLFTGRLYDRFGANVVIYPAIGLMALGLLILGHAGSSLHMLMAASLIGLAYGAAVPGFLTLAIQHSPAHRTSAVTATYFTFLDIGLGTGSCLVGACIAFTGYSGLYFLLSPFVLAIMLLYYRLSRTRNKPALPA
ncbi:MFS transporter [Pelobacter propionicus]|uniref:Major facilitator superfamily MFS_1 n=1 Tax=Pelobacter propionicus (strain DSM 2379 / NBRC 103807 / OttBd1) TaxID=338966 RepID=A1AMB8_PELPD|nr:MFS transporter [Pelobacter propionicus]ABK98488.1 major facilitator superfamily MFS_1 [Pelobacter propionicus DSM 2379]